MKDSIRFGHFVGLVIIALAVAFPWTKIALGADVNAHPPILIQSDSDFMSCACVVSGTGSKSDPFIIGPWSINNASGDAVRIDGASLTKSFVLLNLTIAGNGATTSRGIVLGNINPSGSPNIVATVLGAQTSIQTTGLGILVEQSSYVTLDGAGENPKGAGVTNKGAGTINRNTSGAIDIENSSHITVEGWQMSADGEDRQPDWVSLDPDAAYWGVGGVRFFGVTDSTIDHNAANNCTDVSFSLFNSGHNTVTYNTAGYPFTHNFLIADGSSR